MKNKPSFTRFFVWALVASGSLSVSSHALAGLSDSELMDCKRFAASDHLVARFTEKNPGVSEVLKDGYRKSAFVNISILFACNDPKTAEWQATPAGKDVCGAIPKLAPSEIELKPAPSEMTSHPWRACHRNLLSAELRTKIDQAYNATSDQIGKIVARIMKGEGLPIDREPKPEEICQDIMNEPARTPKRPAAATMALIERAYRLGDDSLLVTPKDSLENFRDLGFEEHKPGVKITDQADVPDAALFILKKTGSCPVPAETGHIAIKCGANQLFWNTTEKNKDLNQFLKDNSDCISSILVRPSWKEPAATTAAPPKKPTAPAAQQVK